MALQSGPIAMEIPVTVSRQVHAQAWVSVLDDMDPGDVGESRADCLAANSPTVEVV
jgi:hypothetical protein